MAASLMAGMIALGCGANAAEDGADATLGRGIKAGDVAGRWSGNHYGFGALRAKCGGKPCTMTVDVTACAKGWCGVLVREDGSCGATAMTIEAGEGREGWMRFNGRLELDPKAASYVIEATLSGSNERAQPAELDIIGDTGTELMFMRRSFPFQAHLARTGEALCSSEKATS